jgi:hypothetical protein
MSTITHAQWVNENLGRVIQNNPLWGGQCVDNVRDYMRRVQGVSTETVEGAAEFFEFHSRRPNQQAAFFCIAYQDGLVPPPGAHIVWGRNRENGYFGHIATADNNCTQTSLITFDQDGVANSLAIKENRPQQGVVWRTRSYNNVLGWLVLRENRNTNQNNTPGNNNNGLSVPVNGRYPPANAIFAPADTNGRIGEYWFNPNTRIYMILTSQGWRNI